MYSIANNIGYLFELFKLNIFLTFSEIMQKILSETVPEAKLWSEAYFLTKRSETFEAKWSKKFFPEFCEKEAKPSETIYVSLSFAVKQTFFISEIGTPFLKPSLLRLAALLHIHETFHFTVGCRTTYTWNLPFYSWLPHHITLLGILHFTVRFTASSCKPRPLNFIVSCLIIYPKSCIPLLAA